MSFSGILCIHSVETLKMSSISTRDIFADKKNVNKMNHESHDIIWANYSDDEKN